MSRLPEPGKDDGQWGDILNDFLLVSLNADGSLRRGGDIDQALSIAQQAANATIADNSIVKAKLSPGVQATLDRADTALQVAPVMSVAGKAGAVTLTYSDISDAPTLATVATTGSYTNLIDKPVIPNIVDATASAKGVVQLAGDLAGTAASPTVTALNGVAVTGVPSAGQVLTATDVTSATWSAASADSDSWLGFAATTLTYASTGAFSLAGRMHFARVTVGTKAGATRIGMHIIVSSGNIMVGVYRASGSGVTAQPGMLAVGTAVTACPAAGFQEITLPSAVDVNKGDYLALWCDNTTATFGFIGNSAFYGSSNFAATNGYRDVGASATSLPANANTVAGFNRFYMLTAS